MKRAFLLVALIGLFASAFSQPLKGEVIASSYATYEEGVDTYDVLKENMKPQSFSVAIYDDIMTLDNKVGTTIYLGESNKIDEYNLEFKGYDLTYTKDVNILMVFDSRFMIVRTYIAYPEYILMFVIKYN